MSNNIENYYLCKNGASILLPHMKSGYCVYYIVY